jgi:REP-associated tyrosine transposase
MARKARVEFAGAVYHVLDRGDRREAIFRDDEDHERFLRTLGETCARTGWGVHAYVLMRNHYHLLLQTPEANLVAGMHWFQATYTQRFNRRHRLSGHLFQGRYSRAKRDRLRVARSPEGTRQGVNAVVVDPEARSYFATLSDYIHLNPVRAHIVAPGEKLYRYRWSSYPAYVGKARRLPWLTVDTVLAELGCEDTAAGRRRYAERLRLRACEENGELTEIRRGWCLGGEAFRKKMLHLLDTVSDKLRARKAVDGAVRRSHGQEAADELLLRATRMLALTPQELAELKNTDRRKRLVGMLLRKHTSVRNVWLAQRLGFGHASAVSRLGQREADKRAKITESDLLRFENAIFKT